MVPAVPISYLLHLFRTLNMHLAGKRFAPDADMKQAATSWLQVLDTDLFYPGIQSLVPRWDRFLNVSCDCWKVSGVPSSIDVNMDVRIKFLASGCLLPNFLKLACVQVYCNNPDFSCRYKCYPQYANQFTLIPSCIVFFLIEDITLCLNSKSKT